MTYKVVIEYGGKVSVEPKPIELEVDTEGAEPILDNIYVSGHQKVVIWDFKLVIKN